jgi:hypothetical protein
MMGVLSHTATLMNDRLIDMLTRLATENPHRKHVVLIGKIWNIMAMPLGGNSKSALIDRTDIRGSIAKFVEANEPPCTGD